MEWISVKDKLPEDGDVLVTDGFASMVCAYRSESQTFDFWNIYWWEHNQVTHWMPLPEPPKTETNETATN